MPEIFKSRPNHCLAQCLWKLGRPNEAEAAFKAARADDPEAGPVMSDQVSFLVEQKKPVEAVQTLHAWVADHPEDVEAWRRGARIALDEPDFLEFALDWTGEAARAFPADAPLARLRAEALTYSGQIGDALALWQKTAANDDRARAAQILCSLVADRPIPTPAGEKEPEISREFFKWYREFLRRNMKPMILAVNGQVETLRKVLPTAGATLLAVLAEADQEESTSPAEIA